MDYAIQVNHVKKAYKLYDNNMKRLKEALFRIMEEGQAE